MLSQTHGDRCEAFPIQWHPSPQQPTANRLINLGEEAGGMCYTSFSSQGGRIPPSSTIIGHSREAAVAAARERR